ncbi:choice-of-anchor Q domain-containing protein [Pontiellaceae bacterium B1224]|nr:choice-of-anchor Q domain-containing protein [Pontiellaceae bacterium B1224]
MIGETAFGMQDSGEIRINREILHAGNSPAHYVSTTGSHTWPYTNSATAATNIQAAVDAAATGDTVRVDSGTYQEGAEITIAKAITLESRYGADETIINGQNAYRCLYLSNGATVDGFTISNGFAVSSEFSVSGGFAGTGGGIHCDGSGTVQNCTVSENFALAGGGIFCRGGGTVQNCTISGNTTTGEGGGIYFYYDGTVENSIIWNNSVDDVVNSYNSAVSFSRICTTPSIGDNCITNDPQLVGMKLSPSSPCIDAGMVIEGINTDIDGMPRPLDGNDDGFVATDIGAYELVNERADSDGDGLSDSAEMNSFGTSPVNSNSDGDPASDYEETIADTDPLDDSDWFRIEAIEGTTVWFQTSTNRQYSLLWSLDLNDGQWSSVRNQSPVMGSGGIDSLTDPNSDPACFYRVEVELP